MFRRLHGYARNRLSWSAGEPTATRHSQDDKPAELENDMESQWLRERDSSGSRFYSQPGFAVLLGEGGSDPSGYDGDTGDPMARVRSALGTEPALDAELGRPVVRDATYGRGAAGWTAVIEWTLDAAAQGVIGLVATAPIVAAARRYVAVKRRMQERGARFLVNRAGAALVALEDVARGAPAGSRLWLEAAEEISAVAGRPPTELNYVGAEPWLVLIVDIDRNLRHVRIVSPAGEVVGATTTSLGELEGFYLPAPE